MESYLPDIFEFIGTIFIAWAALRVHHRVLHQHKMDRSVFKTMRNEQLLGIVGVVLVVIGFLLRIFL